MPRVKSYLKLRKAREQPESAVQYHCHEGNVFMYVCMYVCMFVILYDVHYDIANGYPNIYLDIY